MKSFCGRLKKQLLESRRDEVVCEELGVDNQEVLPGDDVALASFVGNDGGFF